MKVRTAHVEALGSRAQLEGFLSDCLNDVEKQIARHQIESADAVMSTSTGRAHVLEERDRVLELLLSQKRVIALLIEKTFPIKSVLQAYGGPRVRGDDEARPGSAGKSLGGDVSMSEADAILANYAEDLKLNEVRTSLYIYIYNTETQFWRIVLRM
jgi:hypothetical protein